MKRDYFVYNGITYKTGTALIVTNLMSTNRTNSLATFEFFDTNTEEYQISICGRTERHSQKRFDEIYKGVWDGCYGVIKPIPESMPKHLQTTPAKPKGKSWTFQDELNIDGLLIAWIWYIFIMAVATIFYDRIGIWILASVIFFSYRKKKLKEAGYK